MPSPVDPAPSDCYIQLMAPPETRTVTVRLPTELADWVDDEFPHGFKQTFVLQCFLSLRHIMTEGEVPPHSIFARAASVDALGELANPTR